MSDPIGRWIPGLDPLTGSLTLPLWAAGAIAALLVVCCALALSRAGRDGLSGGLARIALVLVGAALTWFWIEGPNRQDFAAERRALEARAGVLAARASGPGSPLACLDAMAGEAVEGSCERTLFATPEAMAAAVSYVAAQVSLFTDVSRFAARGHVELDPLLTALRRAVETDRYGLVAHVLATRDGCAVDRCALFEQMHDPLHINTNLAQRTYDFYVARHATVWPAAAPGPSAGAPPATRSANAPLPSGASPLVGLRPPGPGVFFPSADSIPPVSIMNAEPVADAETTGSARPQQRRSAPQAKSMPPPVNLNVTSQGGAPTAAQ